MKLSSTFAHNGKIPSKYTCDGENINPALKIEQVPANAKSLVLIMDDPDIPNFVKEKYHIEVWDHWIVFNIPPSTTEVGEGASPPGVMGKNTSSKNTYGGPCPPDKEHRYFFKLYALDTTLNLPEGSTKKQVEEAIHGHILEKAELVGRYQKQV